MTDLFYQILFGSLLSFAFVLMMILKIMINCGLI